MSDHTQGARIEYAGGGIPANGCYWRDSRTGEWYGMTPNGMLVDLGNHAVTEHEDGTITASPSILATALPTDQRWHGYLERGVWREC